MKIKLQDTFWGNYRNLIRTEMIPYQWKVLNDDISINIERERDDDTIPNEKSHAIQNLRIAAGLAEGEHYGWVFQDSDVYKWLEAVAYSLMEEMDDNLKAIADDVVHLIGQAQEDDGYLSTYFTIKAPERKFKRLIESHELYCAGHFLEAAVAYNKATGNEEVIVIAHKLADFIDSYFGDEAEGKHYGVDGHEEIEIGLMRLFHTTGEIKYRRLAQYFLDARGVRPTFFDDQRREEGDKPPIIGGVPRALSYFQMHAPVREQTTAEGHAVRVMYLCTAMADVAATNGDTAMYNACVKIWKNVVERRMYITGGVGSTVIGEAFTLDYDLPNDTMYCETCASVGLVFWAKQMLRNEAKGEYADVMERSLYNTCLAGMALDGKHFFYVNPLEVNPLNSKKDPAKSHAKFLRSEWLGCACCPPNLARLLMSVDQYIYHQTDDALFADLYMTNEADVEIAGENVHLSMTTEYPWKGEIKLKATSLGKNKKTIALRIPDWAEKYKVIWDGQEVTVGESGVKPGDCQGMPLGGKAAELRDGYLYLTDCFTDSEIVLLLDMSINLWKANALVKEDIGKVALSRGPFVYCIEGVDNGTELHQLYVNPKGRFKYEFKEDLLGGVGVVEGAGFRKTTATASLYAKYSEAESTSEPVKMKWIPYYAWANRGANEMTVWVHEAIASESIYL